MIATQSPRLMDRLYDYAQKGSLVFGSILVAVFLGLFVFNLRDKQANKPSIAENSLNKTRANYYESIGSGPFSLNEGQLSRFLHSIRKELVILAKNTRPDITHAKAPLLLGLKHAGEEKIVEPGTLVFLECREENNLPVYHFSNEKTSLWVKPSVDLASIKIEVGGDVKEKGEFLARELDGEDSLKEENEPFLALQGVEWCGKDKFIEIYGGEEYKGHMLKHKILFSGGRSSYACFVEKGDYLIWEEGKWKVCPFEGIPPGVGLAYVKSITQEAMDIDSWDEKGFYPFHLKLSKKPYVPTSVRMEEAIGAMRVRNGTQISCVMGKKRMIIKPGDWLIKTSYGWHKLRKNSEIEDFLLHRLQGDLFVVDSFDKEMGKMVIKGQLFDEKRKESIRVSLPVNEEKKTHTKSKRKSKKS